MARNRIRGITVEIGGDTTKLDKALSGTNKTISTTESKLKDVEKLLKMDPKNVELLDQKQRLLAQSVEATADKYKTLQQAAESATVSNVQYAKWEKALAGIQGQITKTANELAKFEKEAKGLEDLGFAPDSSAMVEVQEKAEEAREKLEALKRSATDTFEELGRPMSIDQWDDLQRELAETKDAADEAQTSFDNFSPALSRFGSAADNISDKAGKVAEATRGISLAAGGVLTAMLGSVKGTEEFRSDLSKLETNAQLAGVGLGSTEEALRKLNSVSDETDSSVEALSNLLQSGVTESSLQKAVENLAGAAISFPDTVKIESLADSLQETLATGEATGQFAEVLDRLGVSTEDFNTKLAQVPGEANKLNFALDTLQNQGLAGVYDAWKSNNEALIENKDANLEFQQSLADLGEEMQPLMTTVTQLASSFLDWFNGLSDGSQGAIVALIAIVAAISPVAGAISSVSGAVGLVTQNLGDVEDEVSGVMSMFSAPSPMFLAIAGISAALLLLILNWDKVKETVQNVMNAVVGFIENGINAIKRFFSALTEGEKSAGKASGGGAGRERVLTRQSAVPLALPSTSLDNYPHFATGGVFAPNNPMLGVLGDNRTEYEVAAPESALRETFLDALSMSGLAGGQNIRVNIQFAGNLAQLARVLQPVITTETARLGPSLAPR